MEPVQCLPDEMLMKIFNTKLSPRDVSSCSMVCQRWYHLTCCGYQWRKWLESVKTRKKISQTRYTILEKIAHMTSWKTAFSVYLCFEKKKHPPFWNDVQLYLLLQKSYQHHGKHPSLTRFSDSPFNVLLWTFLQLKLESTGITSPLAAVKPDKQALDYLQTGILMLNQHYGPQLLLEKLKEIASVPPRCFFISGLHHVSSLLLLQIATNCVCEDSFQITWPSSISLFLDWKKHFINPVQTTVIMALKCWTSTAGDCEVLTFMNHWLKCWLAQVCAEGFWADKQKQESASTIAFSIWIKTVNLRPLHSIHASDSPIIMDTTIPAKQVAVQLSSASYHQFRRLPQSDLLNFLLETSHKWRCHNVRWFSSEYGQRLLKPIVTFCTSTQSKKNKVALVHHLISVCLHLREEKDFRTFKLLVSVVRTIVGQTHLTSLTWKDLDMKYCKLFPGLEALVCCKNGYGKYQSYIQQFIDHTIAFVPYLPAHRHLCKQHTERLARSTSQCRSIVSLILSKVSGVSVSRGLLEREKSEIDVTAIDSVRRLQMDDKLNYICSSLSLEELVAAQHVLKYFHTDN